MNSPGRAIAVLSCASGVLCSAVLAGCSAGPDYVRPSLTVDRYLAQPLPAQTQSAPVAGGASQRFAPRRDVPADWWHLFGSPVLDALVDRALAANPNLASAEAALRQASENVAAQRGAYFPTLQASFSPSRQRNAVGTLAPTLNSGQALYSLYTGQVAVSYVADVFGGNRRQVESLAAQAAGQAYQLQAARSTLCANLVAAAIQEAGLRGQIAATQAVIAIESEQLEVFKRQYALGAIAGADVVAQEALLAQTRAGLPGLRKQLAVQRDLIAVLAGSAPADMPAATFTLDSLALPEDLPLGVPSELVERRPDVRAAEALLASASAQIGVAAANRLPALTLTAALGGTATGLGRWLASQNAFWSVGASLAQTLFDGGTLRARRRAAVAAFDQAGALYRAAVLTAFQNVADALEALQEDAEALHAQAEAERAGERSLAIARQSYSLGATGYLALLNAQQTYQQAVLARIQYQANRLGDTVALFQALGGGSVERAPTGASVR